MICQKVHQGVSPFTYLVISAAYWTSWGSWGSCSATCGGGSGTRTRTRSYTGVIPCQGSRTGTQGCLVEENVSYLGNNVNDGISDPRQPDAGSCQLFCMSNYVDAKYFSWCEPSAEPEQYRNTCWCKHSDSGRTDRDETLKTSGQVMCDKEVSSCTGKRNDC